MKNERKLNEDIKIKWRIKIIFEIKMKLKRINIK